MSLLPTSPVPNDGTVKETPRIPSSTSFLPKSLNDSTPTIISNDNTNINNEYRPLQPSPTKEYMTLTPVKLKGLESPLKNNNNNNNQSTQKTNSNYSQSPLRIVSPTANAYKDKFNTISRELEKLFGDLSVIYKKIGYSPSGTKTSERLIFTTLSDQIKEFHIKAEEEMNNLSLNNDIEQRILNAMLDKLNDPNGLNIIPDLYTRNTILLPQNRTVPDSPKKPLSLLEVQKSLNDAKRYVVKAYLPALIKFLNANIELQKNYKMIGEVLNDLDDNEKSVLRSLPSLELSEKLVNLFDIPADNNLNIEEKDVSSLFNKIKDNKKILLSSDNFNSIDERRISDINKINKIYKQEYNFRANNLVTKIKQIKELLNELDIDMNSEFSPSMNDIFDNYLKLNENNKFSLSVTTSTINTVVAELEKIQNVKNERTRQKDELLSQCELLWQKLSLPQSHIDSILKENEGLSLNVINNLNNELKNLEILKKKLIKQLISDSWNKINEYWVTLQISEDERKNFIETYEKMNNDSNSLQDDERLLDYCESETKRLEDKLAIYTPVLKLIKDFQNLLKDKEFLEKSSKDSARLLSRNSHKILLKEEKARKRITRHFPKVICELKQKLEDAQDLFQKPFILNGKNLQDLIEEEELKFRTKFPRSVLSLNRSKRNINSLPKKSVNKVKESLSSSSPSSENNKKRLEENTKSVKNNNYRIHKPKTPNNKLQKRINEKSVLVDNNNNNNNNSSKKMNITKGTPKSNHIINEKANIDRPTDFSRSLPHFTIKTESANNTTSRNIKSKLLSPTVIIPHERKLLNKFLSNSIQPGGVPTTLNRQPFLLRSHTAGSSTLNDYFKENNYIGNKFSSSNNNSSTNNSYTRLLRGIRPTRLFPLDSNKLNKLHKSNIPVLFELKSTLAGIENNKIKHVSNIRHQSEKILVSPYQNYTKEQKQRSLSFTVGNKESVTLASPYRESVNSIYQLSLSPDGKFQLNIRQSDREDNNENNNDEVKGQYAGTNGDIFDDTSILDDDETDSNFIQWKREQLIKLDNLKQKQQEQRILSDNIPTM